MVNRKILLIGTFGLTAPVMFLFIISMAVLFPHLDGYGQTIHTVPVISTLFRAFQIGSGGPIHGIPAVDDARIPIIQKFYTKYNSPLREYSEFIVQTADAYGIDYRLIPAISMQESTGCKFIPENSYNCWGWGIYGDKVTRFSSYQEGIETVSRGLKKNYYDKGLREPNTIMAKYTPPALEKGGSWAKGVNYFFAELEEGVY